MIRLYKKIEEDISSVGINEYYPTQFIVKAINLYPIKENAWVEEESGYIFYKSNDKLHVVIDGLVYDSVNNYNNSDDKCEIDGISQCKGKIGFFISDVKEKIFDEGLILEDGMSLKNKYPKETVVAVSKFYVYSNDSEKYGLKCMSNLNGYLDEEIFVATGIYKDDNHINYDEELVNYIAHSKRK